MTEVEWIVSGIALPCVAALIFLVKASCKRQDIITDTFVRHVEQQTSTLVSIQDTLRGLTDSRQDIKTAITEQTEATCRAYKQHSKENQTEHSRITSALDAMKLAFDRIVETLSGPPNNGMLKAIEEAIAKADRIKTNELIADAVHAQRVEAEDIVAHTVTAEEVRKPVGGN